MCLRANYESNLRSREIYEPINHSCPKSRKITVFYAYMGTDTEKPAKKKSRLHMTHAQNDARYIAQGMALVLSPNPDSAKDLARMNRGKNGRPFSYDEGTIMMIAGLKYKLKLSYRVCEGMVRKTLGEESAPDHTTLCRRINGMNVTSVEESIEIRGRKGVMRLIPDGTGLTPSTRSEWIHHKHKVKRGWIRLSVMIDHDTQKILAFRVTDESIGDSPQFEGLVEDSLKCLGIDADELRKKAQNQKDGAIDVEGRRQPQRASDVIERALKATDVPEIQELLIAALGDGGYDTRIIHSLCKKLGIFSLVKVRRNANSRAKGVDRERALAAQDQLCGGKPGPKELALLDIDERSRNQKEWKRKVGYGRRWLVEIVFSSFKRRFGDSVMARTMKNIINEIGIKVRTYNKLLDIAQEAILRA